MLWLDQATVEFLNRARPVKDPYVWATVHVRRRAYNVNETILVNVTLTNLQSTELRSIWVNATNPDVVYYPSYYYLEELKPGVNASLSFNVSVARPGLHTVSFLIDVGGGEVTLHRAVPIYIYGGRVFFSLEPDVPRFNDNVDVTVYDERFSALPNVTIVLRNSLESVTLVTDEDGVAHFIANVTGIWFLTIYAEGYPVVGPVDFVVLSGENRSYVLNIDDSGLKETYPNSTVVLPFTIVNTGQQNSTFIIHVRAGNGRLRAALKDVDAGGVFFNTMDVVNETSTTVTLAPAHWTCGEAVINIPSDISSNTGSKVALVVTVDGYREVREYNMTVIAQTMYVNVSVTPCLLYTSPSPRDLSTSRMPSSA